MPEALVTRMFSGPDRETLAAKDWLATLLVSGILGALFFALSLVYATKTPRGIPPDEWAHITYVQEAASSPALLPDYPNSRILPARRTANYLKHPALYYSALGAIGKLAGLDASEDYRAYRAISAALVAIGLALWVVTARMLGFGLLRIVPLMLSVYAVPMFPFLAGSINNDNLAYLAVSVAFAGLAGLRHFPRASWYVGAAGLAMALTTKGTAGLFLALVFSFWGVATLLGPSRRMLANRHFFFSAFIALLLVGTYYLAALAMYGEFLPAAGALYSAPQNPANLLGFLPFLHEFLRLMWHYAPAVVSHAPTFPLSHTLLALFAACLLLPVLAFAASRFPRKRHPADSISNAMALATLATLAAHVLVVWRSYLQLGEIHATQPRYYFYLLPTFAVLAFLHHRDNRFQTAIFRLFSIVAVVLAIVVPYRTMVAESKQHAPVPSIAFTSTAIARNDLLWVGLDEGMAGSIDRLTLRDGQIQVQGWAIDNKSSGSALRVDVYYNGTRIGSIEPDRPRPDVANALRNEGFGNSGFQLRISDVPPGISSCDLQFASVQSQGLPIALAPPASSCR